MIKGMTGFAQKRFNFKGISGNVGIRSLNNRYFDLACHLPSGLNAFEERIKNILAKHLKRGRVTVLVSFLSKPALKVKQNLPLAKEYLSSLKKLQRALNLKEKAPLLEIIKFPGVFSVEESEVPLALLWQKIEPVLKKALENLLESRLKEGRALFIDISQHIRRIQTTLAQMRRASDGVIRQKSKTLSGEEFSSFVKSSNIDEEMTRIKFHLNSLKARLKSVDSVGKELDFICQELLREVNTCGAKLPDKNVTAFAIKIKSDIEKIREQVQNIE
jgi:uncharacterized protein (TIGR00255 family)